MEDDIEPSFDALDHLAYSPVDISPLTSVSGSASTSPALSPQRRPRSTRAAAPASDGARNRARPPDAQEANRPSRDGLRIRSKFFVEVPAPSFNLNKRKRKRGEEKETKKRHRNGRSQKRQIRLGPEAPVPDADADVDVDARASPVTVVGRLLPDHLAEDLDVLFCGFNPGLTAAAEGHHYANPSNHFWPCLHLSGFTPILLPSSEDYTLPERYNLGLTNLLDNMTPSVSGLSRGEMAAAVPAVLAKVARFRPRVVCFVGKGIWVHVGPLLRLRANDGGDNNDDDQGDSGRLVARAKESCVTLKEEEMDDSVMACPSSSVIVDPDARPVKAEPDLAGFSATSDPARLGTEAEGGDVSRGHLLAVQNAEETSDKTPSRSMTARKRRGVASLSRAISTKALAPSVFVYGLQPYKAVHDAAIKKANVRETLFCVFPSTSGRVVSHQRDDKVALFKTFRKNLERIKAGTFDTSSMQLVCLPNDLSGQ